MADKDTARAKRSLESSGDVSRLIKDFYARAQRDKASGRPVVWTYGFTPRELWVAMDVPAIALEHVPILLAAKQSIGKYLDIAEQAGFARDLCPYHTTMLGCINAPALDPYLERYFQKPDLIVASNVPCMAESKSFLLVAEKYKVPYYFLDSPLNKGGRVLSKRAEAYYVEGLKGLIDFLGQHGLKLDNGKLAEVVARSREMGRLWSEIEGYRKRRPTPVGIADAVTMLHYTLVYYAGHPEGLAAMQRLRDEVRQRAESGAGVIPDEKYRLLFLGVPPYYNLGLLNYPEKHGGVFVKAEIEYAMTGLASSESLDPARPLETLAKKILTDVPVPTYGVRIDTMRQIIRDYSIDGIIAANKRGCRNFPAGLRLIKDMASREFGIPMTVFDLDGLDLREYNDALVKSHIDSFMETLAARAR